MQLDLWCKDTKFIYTIVVDRYGFSYNAELNVTQSKRDIQKIDEVKFVHN